MHKDRVKTTGSAEWIAEATGRDKLIAELVAEVRANQDAVHQIDEVVAEAMGLNTTDTRCIDIVDRHGRMTAGQLAEEAGLTTGAVTAALDRLENKGYARRLDDPDDRRRVLVEVTDRAREKALEYYGPLKEKSGAFLDGLSDDELRLLTEFNRVSREVNEQRAAEIRAQLANGKT
jgi:DNA-binding MarR family transcriptional regulator